MILKVLILNFILLNKNELLNNYYNPKKNLDELDKER